MANEAVTPPVVGCVISDTNGSFFSARTARFALVLAICISDSAPSIIRAPPDWLITRHARSSSTARRTARATISPTTDPIEPPIKLKSMAAIEVGCPPTEPVPLTAASLRCVLASAAAIRAGYGLRSSNWSGSAEWSPESCRSNAPSSNRRRR